MRKPKIISKEGCVCVCVLETISSVRSCCTNQRACLCVTSFWDCGFEAKNMTHTYFITAVSALTSENKRELG